MIEYGYNKSVLTVNSQTGFTFDKYLSEFVETGESVYDVKFFDDNTMSITTSGSRLLIEQTQELRATEPEVVYDDSVETIASKLVIETADDKLTRDNLCAVKEQLSNCFNRTRKLGWWKWSSVMSNRNFSKLDDSHKLIELYMTRLEDYESFEQAMLTAFSPQLIDIIVKRYNR